MPHLDYICLILHLVHLSMGITTFRVPSESLWFEAVFLFCFVFKVRNYFPLFHSTFSLLQAMWFWINTIHIIVLSRTSFFPQRISNQNKTKTKSLINTTIMYLYLPKNLRGLVRYREKIDSKSFKSKDLKILIQAYSWSFT